MIRSHLETDGGGGRGGVFSSFSDDWSEKATPDAVVFVLVLRLFL